jgi:Tol biopolymer transport system component/DNA-binding winged helix-turn-helix (wHTH) protein
VANLIEETTRYIFDAFEVDVASGEIFKKGFRIKIQSQPFKILCILLEKPGLVVTRDELQLRVWGPDTVVDFDHSLAAAINKLREALGDSAEHPRYIETLARRGYRFVAPVSTTNPAEPPLAPPVPTMIPAPIPPPAVVAPVPDLIVRSRYSIASIPLPAAVVTALLFLGMGLVFGGFHSDRNIHPTPPHITAVTTNGALSLPSLFETEGFSPIVTDGVRLFASSQRSGRRQLLAIPLTGGGSTVIQLPSEVASARIADLSPDGTRLLLRSNISRDSEQPLWIASTMGGSARRVGSILAQDATWMPDGASVLYAAGSALYTFRLSDNTSALYAKIPGRAFWMRWSPDGKRLRFTIVDPISHSGSLWELPQGGSEAKPLLRGWHGLATECCGVWAADGKSFIFQSYQEGATNLWRLAGSSTEYPEQLTDGPLEYMSPVATRSGDGIYFLGKNTQTNNERYEVKTHTFVRGDELLRDALRITYSRDGRWVAWTSGDGTVWRCRVDGSEQLQLTPPGMTAFLASWSPDGRSLATMARKAGEAWHLYLLPVNGGQPQLLLNDGRNAADPSWSPDGKSLAFGRTDDAMGKETSARTVSILSLETGAVEALRGSDGLFSPRWSPDGRFLVALTLDGREARVFSFGDQSWTKLPVESAADPVWSADSKSLWIQQFADPHFSVVRVGIPEMKVQETVQLARSDSDVLAVYLSGLTPEGDLLTRAQTNTGNLYVLSIKH